VLERDRPEYDANGLPAGGFIVYPKIVAATEFNSNALASNGGDQSDWSFIVTPSLLIQSNWNRDELEFGGDLSAQESAKFSSNNELAWRVHGDGRLDIHGNSYVAALIDVRKIYIDRTDTDFPQNAAQPPSYYSFSGLLKGVYEYDRVRLTGIFDSAYLDYGVTPGVSGVPVSLTYRDDTYAILDGRVEYGLSPEFAAFAEGRGTIVRYQSTNGPFGPNPNANEADFLVGGNFDLARLLRGEVAIGVLDRQYSERAYKSNEGVTTSAKVEYFPFAQLTVTASLRRDFVESLYTIRTLTSPGYDETGGRLQADYEFRYNLIITAKIDQSIEQYQDVARNDVVGLYSIGPTWLLNRNVGLNVSYRRYDRSSSGADSYRSFGGNEVFLTLVLQR